MEALDLDVFAINFLTVFEILKKIKRTIILPIQSLTAGAMLFSVNYQSDYKLNLLCAV